MSDEPLPSWRPGPTRDAVVAFLDAAEDLPVEQRLAVFDNDGTLWCERPAYVQYAFFAHALRRAVQDDPVLARRDEFAAVLDDDMLELIDELRRRDFAVAVVSGGGTEFVRAISGQLYGVPPELVVGTLIDYRVDRDDSDGRGRIVVRRTGAIAGAANEAQAKVRAIQSCLGRRPVFAAGNSAGDREMLEWATSGEGPGLALLVDHDDADREFRYQSISGTLEESEPITDIGRRLGWTSVSMQRDWAEVFGTGSAGTADRACCR